MTNRFFLDTSSLMYRAFFSIPASVRDPKGRPINAIHGYLDMTAYLIARHRPDQVVHCFDDDWRPAPRVAAYGGYKAARPPDPEGLPEQFEVLAEVLAAVGLARADAPGWEAEDAIGTLSASVRGRDRADIVTGDRDLIQLVRDPHVRVLFTVKGVSEVAVFDESGVRRKYGVPASRYLDFAILRGDPSDGLPGVKGVGEKTARALVDAYGDIDAMVADARKGRGRGPLERSPRLRTALIEAIPYVEVMRFVVPIRTDLEVRVEEGRRDDDALDRLGDRHRLAGPIRRLREALDARA